MSGEAVLCPECGRKVRAIEWRRIGLGSHHTHRVMHEWPDLEGQGDCYVADDVLREIRARWSISD